jgi:hypothetical protein
MAKQSWFGSQGDNFVEKLTGNFSAMFSYKGGIGIGTLATFYIFEIE